MFLEETSHTLKYVSLVILTVQNALLGLSMRYARTRDGDMFLSSTGIAIVKILPTTIVYLLIFFSAVLMSEIVKLVTCLAVVYVESGGVVQLFETIDKTIIKSPMDTLKVCVPSFVYVIQNNLLYISASHLDAATYQVSKLSILFCFCYNFVSLR